MLTNNLLKFVLLMTVVTATINLFSTETATFHIHLNQIPRFIPCFYYVRPSPNFNYVLIIQNDLTIGQFPVLPRNLTAHSFL